MVGYSVVGVEGTGFTDVEQAKGLLDGVLAGVGNIRDGAFWKLGADDLFDVGRNLERLSHLVYAAQVHLAGEIDLQGLAASRSCASTASLLRQVLNISAAVPRKREVPPAGNRVRAGKQVLPQDLPSGGETPTGAAGAGCRP